MSNPYKYFEHGELYFITSRTEEALPFKDAVYFSGVLEAIIARALELYPVSLVAFSLEPNHIHLLLCAIDPEDVPRFVGHIKQELSHEINALRGRTKKTNWCDGYDSPVLLGEAEALHYITYIYNQSRSSRTNLCNSWKMFSTGSTIKELKRRHRNGITDPKEGPLPLRLEPYAWVKNLMGDASEEKVKATIIEKVRRARKEGGLTPMAFDAPTPKQQQIDDKYVPKRRGQRSYCICWDLALRRSYLSFIKESVDRCREVLAAWRRGSFGDMWPMGFFPPNAVRRANPVFAD